MDEIREQNFLQMHHNLSLLFSTWTLFPFPKLLFDILCWVCVFVKVAQSCPALCDSMDYIVHGILQARILERVAVPFSRGSSQPRDRTLVSRTAGGFFCSSNGEESACNTGDPGLIPGTGRSFGEGNGYPLQYPCLENLMDRRAWRATVHRVAKSRTRPSSFTPASVCL